MNTVPLRCTFAGGGLVRASHANLFFAGMIWQYRVPLKAYSQVSSWAFAIKAAAFSSAPPPSAAS